MGVCGNISRVVNAVRGGCGSTVCGRKKYLNRTLEIDSPFQTLTVGFLVEFID